ncbi:tagaturonate reductase [Siminovitchia sp. 179-K 8D1 HS]|uniref:tagaturonate reductase n=1 Tax=Siminovitchia sp. 179-K 8D1 HS TaxID=3142385 RepID=UPI00399FDD81
MQTLNKQMWKGYQEYPEKVLQFGTGNFLRAFTDWMVHEMNQKTGFNGSVVAIQSTNSGTADKINSQDGLYTLYLQGIVDGVPRRNHEVIHSISRALNVNRDYDEYMKLAESPDMRFVVSNTTEAGIVFAEKDRLGDRPPQSFPAKLAAFLHHRFQFFQGDREKGLYIIPCELIDRNGERLKEIILQYARTWDLGADFSNWIEEANYFCNSLVDRIVPGFPKDEMNNIRRELGYKDSLIVVGEQYHLWAIEGPESLKEEFPAEAAGLNVKVVKDLAPFRESKVYILNGAHTGMTPVAYLYGIDTVGEAMENIVVRRFIEGLIFEEVIPALDLPEAETKTFAEDVLARFSNPYVQHYLKSIALNAMSKFRTRNLPMLLAYAEKYSRVPKRISFSLAAWISFYKGKRGTEDIPLADDADILQWFEALWKECDRTDAGLEKVVQRVLGNERLWGRNLNEVPGLLETTASFLISIEKDGMGSALERSGFE